MADTERKKSRQTRLWLKRGRIGNAILKTDHSVKENRLFIDSISINTYSTGGNQLYSQKFTAKEI